VAHRRLARPALPRRAFMCEIDWARCFDHMQHHSGQHQLSAVFEELFVLHTVSFHSGAESATIDLEGGPVEARVVTEAERRANQVVSENRAMDVRFEDAGVAQGCVRPRSARARCASCRSMGWTGARSGGRMCAPPARSGRSC
jgi:hypothetical protein